MDTSTLVLVIFGTMILGFIIGSPVGFLLGGLAMLFGYFTWGPQSFNLVTSTTLSNTTNFLLLRSRSSSSWARC